MQNHNKTIQILEVIRMNQVDLIQENHTYQNYSKKESSVITVTQLLKELKPFVIDWNKKSQEIALKQNTSPEKIRLQWEEKRLRGTKYHLLLEYSFLFLTPQPEVSVIYSSILEAFGADSHYYPEYKMISTKKVGGCIDLLVISADGEISIIDWKFQERNKYHDSHNIQQLRLYGDMVKELLLEKIGPEKVSLWIVYCDNNGIVDFYSQKKY